MYGKWTVVAATRESKPFGRGACKSKDNVFCTLEAQCEGVYYYQLTEDGTQWRALVNTELTLLLQRHGFFLTS